MSDEAAKHFDQIENGGQASQDGRSVTMTITFHPNGQLEINGPLKNRVLMHGLLGAATAHYTALCAAYDVQQAKQAQSSQGGMDGLLKKMGRG